MPRKNVTKQRSNQVADAFELAIARFGVDGARLEDIARIADIKRPALRHFIGNRDKIILFVVNRFLEDAQRSRRLINNIQHRHPERPLSMLLMHLMDAPNNRVQAMVGLIGDAKKNDKKDILALFEQLHSDYHVWLVALLKTHYKGKAALFDVVAEGILNIAYSQCVLAFVEPNNNVSHCIDLLLSQLTPKQQA